MGAKYHRSITSAPRPELQCRNMRLTSALRFALACARGDLNPHVLADTGT
jgi:hypothetical protein